MPAHTIEVSDTTYQRLMEQAGRLHTTPEQLLERLLTHDVGMLLDEPMDDLISREPTDAEAWAAFQRLTTLFDDAQIPNLEEILSDPMLALAQVGLITNNDPYV